MSAEVGILTCPNCKSRLEVGSVLRCKSCGKSYPIIDGIPDFIGNDGSYWGEIAPDEMERTLNIARERGFRPALMDVVSKHPDLACYLFSCARVDWLFHCFSQANSGTCLDIGSGWGGLTFPLAEYYREVWSLEAVWPRIELQKIVKEQKHIANVSFARASMLHLPFPDQYFDLVTANGILEWAGTANHSKEVREVQLDFLREVRRVLKPTGCVYIGIENRLGVPFLFGARDHSGLRFTSVMPRKAADIAVRLLRKTGGVYQASNRGKEEWKDYRTYTYTAPGYEALLRQAGYGYVETYWTFDYIRPTYSGGLRDPQSLVFYLNHLKRNKGGDKTRFIERVLSVVPLLPDWLVETLASRFSPCFLIYAYPSEKPETFESKILRSTDCKSFLRRSGADSDTGKMHYFLLRNGELQSVLKLARFSKGLPLLDKEEQLMEQHDGIDVHSYEVDGRTVFMEPDLKAFRLNFKNPHHVDQAVNWLLDFQSRTRHGYWSHTELETEVNQLQHYVSEDNPNLSAQTKHSVKQGLDLFLQHASQVQLEKVSEHGDYCTLNILTAGEKMYVIDWEFYREEGNPLFDFWFFVMTLVREASLQKSGYKGNVHGNLVGEGSYSPTVKRLFDRFSEGKGLPPEVLFYAAPYVLARCIRRHDPRFGEWGANLAAFAELLDIWSGVTFEDSMWGPLLRRKDKLAGDEM